MAMTIEILAERVATLEKQMAQLLSKSDPEPKKEKKEDKPNKKRVSGYILFQKAMAAEAMVGVKVKQSDVMSELGTMWKALDDDEREEWNNKAAEQKKASSDEE